MFKLHQYNIEFTAKKLGKTQGFTGNAIRGSFGQALFETDKEIYNQLFEKNKKIPDKIKYLIQDNPPPPYIIDIIKFDTHINKGQKIIFALKLIGDYSKYISKLYEVFEKMAQNTIAGIELEFSGINKVTQPDNQKPYFELNDYKNRKFTDKNFGIILQSPTLLYNNKRLITDFSFKTIFGYINRRIFILDQIYGDKKFKPIEKIPEITPNIIKLSKTGIIRKPDNQPEYLLMGWKGKLDYHIKENADDILPILLFGQHIQIGTGTAFGMGKYKLEYL